MVRVMMYAARKPPHGIEFSRVRAADRGARGEDRGIEVLGCGFERQYHGRNQTASGEEPGTYDQHLLQFNSVANHGVGASSSASLYARLCVHDFHRLAR